MIPIRLSWLHRARPSATLHEIQVCSESKLVALMLAVARECVKRRTYVQSDSRMAKPNSPFGALLVTGASRGIGAAVATMAALRGYAVAVNFQNDAASAGKVVAQIESAGGKALPIQADVAQETAVVRLFERTEAELGRVVALVNNAGISGGFARLEAVTAETIYQVLSVNVAGTMLCAREAVRRMSTRNGGSGGAIVNVSSRAARIGGGGEWVHYAASKGLSTASRSAWLAKSPPKEFVSMRSLPG